MPVIVQLIGAADGITKTPHDGRWFIAGNPHTLFGDLEMTSTSNRDDAKRFDSLVEVVSLWTTVSHVERLRPDGMLNRPLNGMSFTIERVSQ